jgi:type I restriction enzyme S subunit
LRFPEFSGEWGKYTLGEKGETIIGLTYSPKDVVQTDGIIVLRSSNIQNGLIDYKDIVRVQKKIKNSLITKKDDILVCARNGSARLIGKNALIEESDANHSFGAFMMIYRSPQNRFIHHLMNTKRYFSQVGENLGARINQVTTSDLNSFEFYFPTTANEINKIAAFIDLLNERIATQRKVIEKLQSLIGGIYKSIFADIDCSFRLDEICEIRKGQQVNGTELFEDGEYYVMNGGVEPSGCYDKFNTPANTISISEGGNSCGYVQFNNRPFWSGGHCYTLRNVNLQYNLRFLYHYLKANESEIMKLRIGSGLPNIQKKDLAAYCIPNLDIDKQITISKSLDAVQTEIELSKDLLVRYEKQKMFLLSAMFI